MTHPTAPRPIGPDAVTVLGSHWSAEQPWSGLDFTRAELRTNYNDYRLRVPWLHPEDKARGMTWEDDGSFYAVRPKLARDRFVQVEGVWMVERGARE